jgi:hypothetical protein
MLARDKKAVVSAHSAGLTRHDFYFKKAYIHIYNLYLILKTSDHDVVLVKQLYPMSLVLVSL